MPRSKSASHSALTAAARWKITSAPASGVAAAPACGIQQFAEVAADRGDPLVRGQIRGSRRPVDEGHPGKRTRLAARHLERARGQQLPGQARAEEAGTAGDHHVRHGVSASAARPGTSIQ